MLDVFYFQFYILLIYMGDCEQNNLTLCECDNFNSIKINSNVQCRACTNNDCNECRINLQKAIQARIQNQVGVSESQLQNVNSALTISFNEKNEKGNILYPNYYKRHSKIFGNKFNLRNQSDRTFPSRSTGIRGLNNVPTRGNSVTSSITRNRPGQMAPGGIGVDVKHGSYARYLAKIKASNILGPNNTKYGPFDKEDNDVNKSNNRLARQNAGKESRLRPSINNKQYRFSLGLNNRNCINC